MARTSFRRRALSTAMISFCALSVVVAMIPLGSILYVLARQGLPSLSYAFFTQLPKPVGEIGGGMANAIVGSGILIGLAAVLAVPVGVVAGIYLSEYRKTALASAVRFAADVLNGVPSIVVGIFAYSLAVLPLGRFSAMAGGLALGIMMIPIIVRTTEELLNLVPPTLRDGALALGATRARAVFSVILPAALPGILTGILVALARVAGETAPLLFTALNNSFWSTRLDQPIASLTVQIYTYALSAYDDWHRQAWAGATVLIGAIMLFSLVARVMTRRLERMHRT
jgi:phosphate transport system permease protein